MKHMIRSFLTIGLLLAGLSACNLPGGGKAVPSTVPQAQNDPASTPNGPGVTTPSPIPVANTAKLVQPEDLVYLGAFRLPDGGERPLTFEYGGNAMTFRPDGDPSGPDDGFPGSLFISGHDRLPYGELPDGSQVAEINIPVPVQAGAPGQLNTAEFLQGFQNVAAGFFTGLDEIPRLGMAYLDTPATGPLVHLSWGEHLQPDPPAASHAWFSPDLEHPNTQDEWFLDDLPLESVNGYLFAIPTAWADTYASGRPLAAGRFRDGGWSGMGPSLIAYRPWIDENGTPAASGTHLETTILLLYESSQNTPNIEHSMNGYQHPDEWEGGAWLTTGTGKTAVVFAGTKSVGDKYWYGWVNPAGAQYPSIETEMLGQYQLCYQADSSACPAQDLTGCSGHNDYRGWWTTRFEAQIIFYNPMGVEADMLGIGDQRRYRIGDVAYDQANGLLYILELFAEAAKPVVHVWSLE